MTLSQLKHVVEVAKTGSINQAATNLFLSQSVLSVSISNLEKEIGEDIFTRTNRGVMLTPFGHTFVSYVSSIQDQLTQLDHLVSHNTLSYDFSLSIAHLGYYFLDKICADFYKKYRDRGIRIKTQEDHINGVADLVASSSAELGIVGLWSCFKAGYIQQIQAKGLQYYPIANLDIAITVGKSNPLYNYPDDSIPVSDIRDYPAIKFSYIDFGPYGDIYKRLKLSVPPNLFVVTSRSTVYEFLRSTDAYYLNSLYPESFSSLSGSDPYSEFRTLRLKDCPIQTQIGWVKRSNHVLSSLEDEFIQKFTRFFFE